MSLTKRAMAELFGTFWLVSAAAAVPCWRGLSGLGIGFWSFPGLWLTVLTMAYAIAHLRCHLNPAVSIGLAVGRRSLP